MSGLNEVAAGAVQNRRVARRFYIGMAAVIGLISVAGFGPSLLDPATRNVALPLTPVVAIHALLSLAWILLFLVQATLIATRRISAHRSFGIAGATLALVLIAQGYVMAVEAARRGFDLTRTVNAEADPIGAFVTRSGLFLAFGILVGTAVLYRHRADVHRRLILLASVGPLSLAPVTHLVRHWIPADAAGMTRGSIAIITISLLSASAIYDWRSRRQVHPVSAWVAIGVFSWQIAFAAVLPRLSAVRDFAAWLVG